MADIAALKAALDAAEAAEEALIAERRQNRDSMSKAEFRSYNQATQEKQIELSGAIRDAQKALAEALNDVRSEALNVAVGTVSESGSMGGTNNG
jgi:Skp family chaperone for outer membrane proteins